MTPYTTSPPINLNALTTDQADFLKQHNLSPNNLYLHAEYYAQYDPKNCKDVSFFVYDKNQIKAFVLAYHINGMLSLSNDNGVIIYCEDTPPLVKYIINALENRAQTLKCTTLRIQDPCGSPHLSCLSTRLCRQGYQSNVLFNMQINAKGFTPKAYFSKIRKSYKSLINWGRNNLSLKIISSENPDEKHFNEFREFHAKIAGQYTRSQATWDTQFQLIQEHHGEALFGYLDNRLVAANLCFDQYQMRQYCVGVYERSLFQYGLSHYLLYISVCRALEQSKIQSFSLGFLNPNITDVKLKNIQTFKKGFCETLAPYLIWTRTLSMPSEG